MHLARVRLFLKMKWPGRELKSLGEHWEALCRSEFRKQRHPEQWSGAQVTHGMGTIIRDDGVTDEKVEVENDHQKVIWGYKLSKVGLDIIGRWWIHVKSANIQTNQLHFITCQWKTSFSFDETRSRTERWYCLIVMANTKLRITKFMCHKVLLDFIKLAIAIQGI